MGWLKQCDGGRKKIVLGHEILSYEYNIGKKRRVNVLMQTLLRITAWEESNTYVYPCLDRCLHLM